MPPACDYYYVADDFAAISKRLKEIQREAVEIAASEHPLNNERQPESHNAYDFMSACA